MHKHYASSIAAVLLLSLLPACGKKRKLAQEGQQETACCHTVESHHVHTTQRQSGPLSDPNIVWTQEEMEDQK